MRNVMPMHENDVLLDIVSEQVALAKGGIELFTSIHCCNAPRNNRKQHGGSSINWGDHSSIRMRPMSSSGIGIMSNTAKILIF